MNIIYVDDEKIQLENFRLTVEGMEGIDSLNLFESSEDAYEWAKAHSVDIAFCDIEMPHMDGIELAKKLKELDRNISIIFVTAYDQYALDAFKARATAYLLKPYTRKDIETELENVGYIMHKNLNRQIMIKTMPDLLVTVNDKPVFEGHSKQEELFALLVDRGRTGVTRGDAFACLWEDKIMSDSTYWTCWYRLKKILEDAGISELLISNGNTKYIDTSKVDCDLYRMLDGDKEIAGIYSGSYLRRYSWAEERVAQLNEIKKKIIKSQELS